MKTFLSTVSKMGKNLIIIIPRKITKNKLIKHRQLVQIKIVDKNDSDKKTKRKMPPKKPKRNNKSR